MNKNIYVLGIGEVLWDMLPGGKQCGGAPANVIYHLNNLGINGILVSAVGSDSLGDELLAFLNSRNITTDFISKNNLETGVVDVTADGGQLDEHLAAVIALFHHALDLVQVADGTGQTVDHRLLIFVDMGMLVRHGSGPLSSGYYTIFLPPAQPPQGDDLEKINVLTSAPGDTII